MTKFSNNTAHIFNENAWKLLNFIKTIKTTSAQLTELNDPKKKKKILNVTLRLTTNLFRNNLKTFLHIYLFEST